MACLPSKNVIYSAKVASLVGRHREFGIETGPISIDMAGVYARKREMVEGIVQVHLDRFHAALDPHRGDELILGDAAFVAPRTVRVALRDGGNDPHCGAGVRERWKPRDNTRHARLAGGQAADPYRGAGSPAAPRPFSRPRRRLRRSGTKPGPAQAGKPRHSDLPRQRLAANEDADVSEAISAALSDEGIEVLLRTHVLGVNGISGEHVSLQLQSGEMKRTVEGTDILVALGRTPNTSGIGLEKAGIEVTEKGHIRVNDRLETTAADVWAMGDCAGSPYFTHVSEDDFAIIHENLNGGRRSTRDRLVPSCVFIDPELAQVGLNESRAREKGIAYRVASVPVTSGWRPWTISEKRGFMKTLIDRDSDRILGFTAFGPEAGELMGTVQLAMLAGLPYTILRDAMFAHPTMTEGLKALFMGVPQRLENHAEQLQHARTSAD